MSKIIRMPKRVLRVFTGTSLTGVLLAVTVLAVAGAVGVRAQPMTMQNDLPVINVTGEAVVNVVPDRIVITLGIETWDGDISTAKEKNNDILRDAVQAIRRMDVEDRNIQTDHLSIEPRYRDSYRAEDFIGYFVRNTLAVTLDDPARVENLVTAVLDAGVNYIHGIEFQTTEYKKHREHARELALQAAREKAEKMAAALGHKIGDPLRISENGAGSPWGYWSSWSGWGHGRSGGMSQNVMQNIPGGASDITGTVALGKISIRAAVGVTFILK